jgi:enoyl-[acyl-carrier-protein] reductase (NADH)
VRLLAAELGEHGIRVNEVVVTARNNCVQTGVWLDARDNR